MPKKVIINALLFVLAVFLTITVITFSGVEVFKKSDLNAISCGWPLNFITQDQSWRDPPYPWTVPCFASPLENPTKFYWERFIFDIAFFYLFILALYYYYQPDHKKNTKEEQDYLES